MPGNYRIEIWSFPVVGSPLRHNFLVQVDGNGNVLKEIHGGAKGPVNYGELRGHDTNCINLQRLLESH
jgi:hypothetical protein